MKKMPKLPHGYALWFVSEDPLFYRAQAVIRDLSSRYSTSSFEPHISLLGVWEGPKSEAVTKTQKLAENLSSFEVSCGHFGFTEDYFRSLFIHIKETPLLTKTYDQAHSVYEIQKPAPFMPHLSLFYGDLPIRQKEALAQEIQPLFLNQSLTVSTLELYKITNVIEEWKCVQRFKLNTDH